MMPMENVAILSGDTDTTPFDVGAYASSGTYFSGGAVAERGAEDEEAPHCRSCRNPSGN